MHPEPAARAFVDLDRPVFVAGPDRSGTTLMFALLASHPDVCMVRRTNMWRYFYRRYGDLADPANLDGCLDDMVRYRRMRHLQPDEERIRREFAGGPPTYGRLFALFHAHNAERAAKSRWGDKSLHTERFADDIFTEFPDARIVHMVRDPRDRYASVRHRNGQQLSRVGAATGRWIRSTRAAVRGSARYPDRYLIVRYEDLAGAPEATMRRVCEFVDVPFSPSMFAMAGLPELLDSGGNSSFTDMQPGTISARAIGRFRTVLTPSDIAFMQLMAGRGMDAMGYERERTVLSPTATARFLLRDLPLNGARMAGWMTRAHVRERRGIRVPRSASGAFLLRAGSGGLNMVASYARVEPVATPFIHASAIVEDGATVGTGTRIWHRGHVREGSRIGRDCTLGFAVYVDTEVVVGDGCKIQNHVSIYRGVVLADDVFVGPSVAFTNDLYPRAGTAEWQVVPTHVDRGASIGANATIVCGVHIGEWAMIAAGAIVTAHVPAYGLIVGVPGRLRGWVCRCGWPLTEPAISAPPECPRCGPRPDLPERNARDPRPDA